MKEFKELSSYKNRGNSYIFIPYIVKAIKRIYKQPFVFVPNSTCPEAPSNLHSYLKYECVGIGWNRKWNIIHEPKIPRNSPCPCGSGKKYKKCCLT